MSLAMAEPLEWVMDPGLLVPIPNVWAVAVDTRKAVRIRVIKKIFFVIVWLLSILKVLVEC
jgi:hypothetical protein